jgi:hypothetical protein
MDKAVRVVASYTTMPSRYDSLRNSLLSMKAQTHKVDAIYLAVPKICTRLNKEYPPLPEDILSLCTVVNPDIDYGPLTKIYGALVSESDPNTVIISFDDDVIVAPNFVETMMKHHQTHPKSVICGIGALIGKGPIFMSIVSNFPNARAWNGFIGFDVPKEGRRVDLVFGVGGVLYTRGCFPVNEELHDKLLRYSLEHQIVFRNDDVLISGYLSKQGIERRIFYDIPDITHKSGSDSLCGGFFKTFNGIHESVAKVKELGFFPTMEALSVTETPAGRAFIGIVIIVLIILLSIFFFNRNNLSDVYGILGVSSS